ncbi:MAG TPA: DUF3426 domain-containing protein [Rhizobiales bacterium]|nr:DUF3426 domain-containing protein [Hyphomicrobiales bacterium]
MKTGIHMILECPNCETSYEIPVELPPEGRKVRCVGCQHVWTATSAVPPPQPAALPDFDEDEIIYKDSEDAFPEPRDEPGEPEAEAESAADSAAEPPAPEPETEAGAETAPDAGKPEDDFSEAALEEAFSTAVQEGQPAPEEPASTDAEMGDEAGEEAESPPIVIGKARKLGVPIAANVAAGWAGLALVLAGVVSAAYFQRVNVVRALPGAASAYERIGLPVNVRGIEFEKVEYSWEMSAGRPVLEVYGDIVNVTSGPLKVPTVVFGLRTKEKVEVYQWAADVRSELLPAGERTAFSAQIPTPPKSIRDVQVRFAKVR